MTSPASIDQVERNPSQRVDRAFGEIDKSVTEEAINPTGMSVSPGQGQAAMAQRRFPSVPAVPSSRPSGVRLRRLGD
jgi:hypothetical protein